MINLDLNSIAEKLIILAVGGFVSWVFGSIIKLRRDVNAAFGKLRGSDSKAESRDM